MHLASQTQQKCKPCLTDKQRLGKSSRNSKTEGKERRQRRTGRLLYHTLLGNVRPPCHPPWKNDPKTHVDKDDPVGRWRVVVELKTTTQSSNCFIFGGWLVGWYLADDNWKGWMFSIRFDFAFSRLIKFCIWVFWEEKRESAVGASWKRLPLLCKRMNATSVLNGWFEWVGKLWKGQDMTFELSSSDSKEKLTLFVTHCMHCY